MRKWLAVWATLVLMWASYAAGRAAERDEAALTVQIGAADHEMQEGYFSLGEGTTLMVKPGSTLFNFLARQRGRRVKIVLTEAADAGPSRLER